MSSRVYTSVFSIPMTCWEWLLDWICCHRLYGQFELSGEEQEAMNALLDRTTEPKNETNLQEMLNKLWKAGRPLQEKIPEVPSSAWKELGFQGNDPSTDVRAGLFVMRQLDYIAVKYPTVLERLVAEALEPERYYSFAIVCFNISFMLTRYFRLTPSRVDPAGQGREASRVELKAFARRLTQDAEFPHKLFAAAVLATHTNWRADKTLSILNYSECLKSTLHLVVDFVTDSATNWTRLSPAFAELIEQS